MGTLPRFRIYTNKSNYFQVLKDILSLQIKNGEEVKLFEEKIKSMTGASHALAMPQNRVGTYLSIKALIRPGQNVLLSPFTIHEVVNMVICAGGIPVFVDIDKSSYNIDVNQLEKKIKRLNSKSNNFSMQ